MELKQRNFVEKHEDTLEAVAFVISIVVFLFGGLYLLNFEESFTIENGFLTGFCFGMAAIFLPLLKRICS